MSGCCSGSCGPISVQFDAKRAEADLRLYKRKGPNPTTQHLRDGIVRAGVGAGKAVLDVGAGIGAASFELLAAGFSTALTIDASPAYVVVARREAEARGLAARMTIIEGDFVTTAATLPTADTVVLDRAVCCYPHFRPLLEAALAHSGRLLAISYPRDRWYVRLVVAMENFRRAVRRNAFRVVVHSGAAMEELILLHGFQRASRTGTLQWCVDVYQRRP
jgi:magnesium-protoporphyrin O-methyltransferase